MRYTLNNAAGGAMMDAFDQMRAECDPDFMRMVANADGNQFVLHFFLMRKLLSSDSGLLPYNIETLMFEFHWKKEHIENFLANTKHFTIVEIDEKMYITVSGTAMIESVENVEYEKAHAAHVSKMRSNNGKLGKGIHKGEGKNSKENQKNSSKIKGSAAGSASARESANICTPADEPNLAIKPKQHDAGEKANEKQMQSKSFSNVSEKEKTKEKELPSSLPSALPSYYPLEKENKKEKDSPSPRAREKSDFGSFSASQDSGHAANGGFAACESRKGQGDIRTQRLRNFIQETIESFGYCSVPECKSLPGGDLHLRVLEIWAQKDWLFQIAMEWNRDACELRRCLQAFESEMHRLGQTISGLEDGMSKFRGWMELRRKKGLWSLQDIEAVLKDMMSTSRPNPAPKNILVEPSVEIENPCASEPQSGINIEDQYVWSELTKELESIYSNVHWRDAAKRNWELDDIGLKRALVEFENSCLLRGCEKHESLKDCMRHLDNYMHKKFEFSRILKSKLNSYDKLYRRSKFDANARRAERDKHFEEYFGVKL